MFSWEGFFNFFAASLFLFFLDTRRALVINLFIGFNSFLGVTFRRGKHSSKSELMVSENVLNAVLGSLSLITLDQSFSLSLSLKSDVFLRWFYEFYECNEPSLYSSKEDVCPFYRLDILMREWTDYPFLRLDQWSHLNH